MLTWLRLNLLLSALYKLWILLQRWRFFERSCVRRTQSMRSFLRHSFVNFFQVGFRHYLGWWNRRAIFLRLLQWWCWGLFRQRRSFLWLAFFEFKHFFQFNRIRPKLHWSCLHTCFFQNNSSLGCNRTMRQALRHFNWLHWNPYWLCLGCRHLSRCTLALHTRVEFNRLLGRCWWFFYHFFS